MSDTQKKRKVTTRKNTKAAPKEAVVQEVNENQEIVEVVKPLGKRTPMHKQKAVGIKARPGYVARQVVEKPGRIEQFLEAGYTFCQGQDRFDMDNRIQAAKGLGDLCRSVVNFHNLSAGEAASAVWMEIPEELYEEDQRAKLLRSQEKENEIDPTRLQKDNPDVYYTSQFKKSREID
jgi:hypothetical protein